MELTTGHQSPVDWPFPYYPSDGVSSYLDVVCMMAYFYRPERSFGQGNIFTGVCLSTGGGCACSKFSGGEGCLLQIFGGEGGACSKFSGGVPAPNFRGVPAPNFRGGACSKFSGGVCLLQIFRGGVSNFRNTVNVRPVRILLECILVSQLEPLKLAIKFWMLSFTTLKD